ncbi:IS66 family insertion sequence element accessory protein TnpB [Sphingobacterium bovisgrunnientis]|uniref:IS66 family insertion sequence element accessory protein TnpB n=1 Tax=Sphingobacterium bovisgrunnientis TaxID=1874697 RepID=UPI003F68D38F
MFALSSSHRFYLYDGFCDMRKSFDGLCGLISSVMHRQATNGEVFVFLNYRGLREGRFKSEAHGD